MGGRRNRSKAERRTADSPRGHIQNHTNHEHERAAIVFDGIEGRGTKWAVSGYTAPGDDNGLTTSWGWGRGFYYQDWFCRCSGGVTGLLPTLPESGGDGNMRTTTGGTLQRTMVVTSVRGAERDLPEPNETYRTSMYKRGMDGMLSASSKSSFILPLLMSVRAVLY